MTKTVRLFLLCRQQHCGEANLPVGIEHRGCPTVCPIRFHPIHERAQCHCQRGGSGRTVTVPRGRQSLGGRESWRFDLFQGWRSNQDGERLQIRMQCRWHVQRLQSHPGQEPNGRTYDHDTYHFSNADDGANRGCFTSVVYVWWWLGFGHAVGHGRPLYCLLERVLLLFGWALPFARFPNKRR